MKIHQKYISRCIELAKNGLGTTYPNPLVGSVIVHNDLIIGEGWHQQSGEAHAEVNAINSVRNKNLLVNSTIYVSLEPCSHFGKTPPCADLIIKHKIPKVIIGTQDPFAKVCGAGIKKLKEAGCEVIIGVLEKECQELNKRFFTFHQKKRPYIILKWAETADGLIAPHHKDIQKPVWISNSYSRQLTHKWRTEEQAILIGTQTVLDDNPHLTARDWQGTNPIRIVLDKKKKISKENIIFDKSAPTFILDETVLNHSKNSVSSIIEWLYQNQIQSIIIEGGSRTLQHFIDHNYWDEARVFRGTNTFLKGIIAPSVSSKKVKRKKILNDELLIFSNYDQ
ncbi:MULTISPECIES: bifunctional diaminohydroxyphosphoribosylaminopyrimidine deaminase/5-amino-6-(5-phosphoribosylamino)uracil reductase RibD [Flavobacterium]|uniref:Riboflavin biosynthesis protein RibD n=2 Tax=Flavobacterium TaxID=237 RepID=A0A437U7G5_9FLAO|nr:MULTISPECIES: bifunctional diaminohydroxyphosphoribosylaminopyrimidine deaminase/5-amino-6-(5-phosphoribosylamino)uracil reductase RibD [Flavobacterium]OWP84257.1 riboflavin biosynthesis protein RibD [Flavobacterium davisii]RVU89580.1 bifunctional diaminohydroxyphosphoribosylaminopyrimidine deaminase/5-amino-6-(5-phosphoribosylamino)uracil reductase RibD [Flavobacterium columnare]SPE77023.1 Riboflavin biosynthesis protein RibD [Flavobacterium columnare]